MHTQTLAKIQISKRTNKFDQVFERLQIKKKLVEQFKDAFGKTLCKKVKIQKTNKQTNNKTGTVGKELKNK